MSKSLQICALVLEFLVVSLAASDPKILSMVKKLQQQAKKQDSVVEFLQTHIGRQEEAISAFQDKVQRQDERLLQQEHMITTLHGHVQRQDERLLQQEHLITTLREHGQLQDERLMQQEHLITTLREHGQLHDERLMQQEHLITTLREHGQRQDERLFQQEHLITTFREHGQRQEQRLLQQEHLTTTLHEQLQTQNEFNDKIQEQKRRQNKTHNEIYNPLQFRDQWKNQKEHTIKSSQSNTEPLSDRLHELPVNQAKKDVLPPKPIERKVPTPELALRAVDGPIAFQAKVNEDISHLGLNQKIVFGHVLLNLGSVYDELSGVFTAPRSGMYIFSTSLLVSNNNEIEAQMIKNGDFIAGVIADGLVTYGQGSVTVVQQLETGDEVWVANTWPADTGVRGKGYSSFMGCLVVEI